MNRERRTSLLTALLATLVLALGVRWFNDHYERVEQEETFGPSGWAAINPHLALERFLVALGVPTRTWYRLEALPRAGAIVVLTHDSLERSRLEKPLVDWTLAGGSLWVVAVSAAEDPFMKRFSAELVLGGAGERSAPVSWPEEAGDLSLVVQGALSTTNATDLTIAGPDGAALAFMNRWGAGEAVLLVDDGFLTNSRLGDADHGRWVWTAFGAQPEVVLLVRNVPSDWWRLLGRHGWMVLVSLGALLLVWLLRVVPRFGPVQPEPAPVRRGLLDHVEAAGAWMWRQDLGEQLLLAARRHCEARLRRRLPGLAELEGGALIHHVAAWSGRSEDRVREALYGQPRGMRDFTRVMQELQILERKVR